MSYEINIFHKQSLGWTKFLVKIERKSKPKTFHFSEMCFWEVAKDENNSKWMGLHQFAFGHPNSDEQSHLLKIFQHKAEANDQKAI